MNDNLTKRLLIGVLFLSAGASANGLDGAHRSHGGFGDPDRLVAHMTRQLDLDDTQAQYVQNIVDAARPELTDLRDRAWQNHKAIRSLDTSDRDFDTKLANLARENGELAAAATLLHGRLRAELNAVLTPEQRQELSKAGFRKGKHRERDR